MGEKKGFKSRFLGIVNSKLFMLVSTLIIMSLISVIAGDVIVKEGDITVDTNVFHVDSANNRVGVGTIIPSEKLEVYNGNIKITESGNSSDPTIKFADYGGVKFSIGLDNSEDSFSIGTTAVNISTRIKIDSNGNVMIGAAPTASPSPKLNVAGSVRADSFIEYSEVFLGDALSILTNMKERNTADAEGWAPLSHESLPKFVIEEYITKGSCSEINLPGSAECIDLSEGKSKVYGRSLNNMIAINSRAINQLQAEIEELKARIAILESSS